MDGRLKKKLSDIVSLRLATGFSATTCAASLNDPRTAATATRLAESGWSVLPARLALAIRTVFGAIHSKPVELPKLLEQAGFEKSEIEHFRQYAELMQCLEKNE